MKETTLDYIMGIMTGLWIGIVIATLWAVWIQVNERDLNHEVRKAVDHDNGIICYTNSRGIDCKVPTT